MSNNTMPERISAYIGGSGLGCFELHPNIPLTTEYIRADVAQAQLDAANARIAELEAAQAWVSVDERLPEPLVDVYVCNDGYGGKGWLSEKGVWYMGLYPIHVTHWMPLPSLPVTDVTP